LAGTVAALKIQHPWEKLVDQLMKAPLVAALLGSIWRKYKTLPADFFPFVLGCEDADVDTIVADVEKKVRCFCALICWI
jgi:hypothetical protein